VQSALQIKLSIVPLVHRVAAFGLVIREHDSPGTLDAKKAAQLVCAAPQLSALDAYDLIVFVLRVMLHDVMRRV
jgi:hypothetical protein